MRFLEKLSKKFCLLVSLPKNDPKLALIAEGQGADALKVHLNVKHHASGTLFKSWKDEKKKIKAILKNVKIPVGIVPGAETVAPLEEMLEMQELGLDFWDIFAHHLPGYLFDLKNMGKMTAINYEFPLDYLPELEGLGIDIIETSIIPPSEYGKPLTARDLAFYKYLIKKISSPAVIPTQRKIAPSDIVHLKKMGASGIGIGAVVTGHSKNELKKCVKAFAQKIKELNYLEEL